MDNDQPFGRKTAYISTTHVGNCQTGLKSLGSERADYMYVPAACLCRHVSFGIEHWDDFSVFDAGHDSAVPRLLADHPGAGFCDIANCSLHGLRVHGIGRDLEWSRRDFAKFAVAEISKEGGLRDILRRPVDEVGVPLGVEVDGGE